MADGKVTVDIQLRESGDGAKKAVGHLNGVGAAAKKTGADAKKGFDQAFGSAGRLSEAFGKMRMILSGFGIGAFAAAMTAGIAKIASSFSAAKKAAEDFAAVQRALAEEKGIASLAADYAKLKDAIADAAQAENRQLELVDLEVANRRALAKAQRDAEKEKELAALDPEAKDYDVQKSRIEQKYAAFDASAAASDARENIVLARQKTLAAAGQTDKEAEAQDAATKALEARLAAARRAKSKADLEAADLNAADKTNAASAVGKTIGQFFTGDWGRMGGAKTAEGDAVRQDAAKRAAELEKQIDALKEEIRKSNEAAKRLRQDAEHQRAKAEAMGGALEAADASAAVARQTANRTNADANRAVAKNHAEQAAEAAREADAENARRLLAGQKADLKQRIEAEQAKKDAANRAVYDAQGDLDLARANGGRGAQASALANLQTAQNAAQEVSFAADKAINALAKTLQDVERRLEAAKNFLESRDKRNRNEWAEKPAG